MHLNRKIAALRPYVAPGSRPLCYPVFQQPQQHSWTQLEDAGGVPKIRSVLSCRWQDVLVHEVPGFSFPQNHTRWGTAA